MGLEGGPEGPEDPIAQICISLGTVCAMGTTVVSMKDVFKAAKWHDCYKCGGCKEMKCQQCKGTGRVVGQFPEDEFDDEGRFLGA